MNKAFTLTKALIVSCALFCLPIANAIGQDITIDQGGTAAACSGNFYDSGGPTASYSSNENYSIVLTGGLFGTDVELTFTTMDVEVGYDVIQIYDGVDATAPLLYDSDVSNSANPGVLTSTNGSLFITFSSDGSIQNPGWEATMACVGTGVPTEASLNSVTLDGECGNARYPITVNVQNGGTNDQVNMNVHYQVNGGAVVTEALPDTLFSGTSMNYTFNQTANFAQAGSYDVTAWVALTGDPALSNDTATANLTFSAPLVDIYDSVICAPGVTMEFTASGGTGYVWYGDFANNGFLSTADTLEATINSDTSFQVYFSDTVYSIATLADTGSSVDHDAFSGDDRGGIAVTDSYVYFNGDNNCARYTVNDLTNGQNLPIRDGIFSDLATGELYTLFNVANGDPSGTSTTITVDAIVRMDTDLVFVDTINLSQSFDMGGSSFSSTQAGIYAGNGYVLLYTGTSGNNWYKIDLPAGTVTLLNTFLFDTKRSSENWASWGVANYKNGAYQAVFRKDGTNDIAEINIDNQNENVIRSFTDLSDMASITYSPWLDRLYYHHENTSQFSGGVEMGGYIGGTLIDGIGPADGCPATVLATITNSVAELGDDTTFCDGNTLTLNPGDFVSYTWTPSASTPTVDVTTTGTYSVTATDQYGCDKSDTIDVTVTPLPAIDLGGDTVICEGSFLPLNPGSGFDSYVWDNSSVDETRIVNAAGTYSVTVTNDNCSSVEDIQVLVSPLPVIDLGPDTLLAPGATISLSAGSGYTSYDWSTTDTTSIINFTAFSDTYINVVVTDQYGCEGTDQILIKVAVGIDEIAQVNDMQLYPNPAPNQTNLVVSMAETAEAEILITDITGKQMYHQVTTFHVGEQRVEIPMEDWATGIYMINVLIDDQPAMQGKLIKQ